jgi:hypothetical protein
LELLQCRRQAEPALSHPIRYRNLRSVQGQLMQIATDGQLPHPEQPIDSDRPLVPYEPTII